MQQSRSLGLPAQRKLVSNKCNGPRRLPRPVNAIEPSSLSSLVPAQLADVLTDTRWAGLEPHFGTKWLKDTAINVAKAGLPEQVRDLSAGLQLPQLPSVPQIQQVQVSLPQTGLPAIDLQGLQQAASDQFTAAGRLLSSPSSLSGAAAGAGQLAAGISSGIGKAVGPLATLLNPIDASVALEPHFGSSAVAHAAGSVLEQLSTALGTQALTLQHVSADSETASALWGTLSELRRAAGVLAVMPPAPELLSGSGAGSTLSAALSVLQGALDSSLAATSSASAAAGSAAAAWGSSAGSAFNSATASLGLAGVNGGILDSEDGPSLEAMSALIQAASARLLELQAAGAGAPGWGVGGAFDMASVSLAAAGVLLLGALSTPSDDYPGGDADSRVSSPISHAYDPDVVASHFSHRPVAVARRSAQVALQASKYGVGLLMDIWTNKVKENENMRAVTLRESIQSLGPAYVKVAQALSTRVDLLPAAYLTQIQLLQDRVQPFSCNLARAVMTETFGKPVEDVFVSLSEKPVAAASLGQVYRATLKPDLGGGDVAIKVLRPGVLEQVALDLYIIRHLAGVLGKNSNTDWLGVIDNWAVRFFHEMDYMREADTADIFRGHMAPLSGILVPEVVRPLSGSDVLVTRWVEGEKLSESSAPDVRALCSTLLNAYLIQLMDTGFLHADPHPGNLIRTRDGRIAVLDYGLMTEVTEVQRVALVGYIAHICTEDWEGAAMDLQVLGFMPAELDVRSSGLVEPLGGILSQLIGGGGAAKVNIDKVIGELEALGNKYPFRVPPFFALVLRAFSVIEGIALTVDPDYAIVQECFPYIARRLLNDNDPRIKQALRDVLYGKRQRLDVDRLIRLADGLSAFTTDGLTRSDAADVIASQASLTANPYREGSASPGSSTQSPTNGSGSGYSDRNGMRSAGAASSSGSGRQPAAAGGGYGADGTVVVSGGGSGSSLALATSQQQLPGLGNASASFAANGTSGMRGTLGATASSMSSTRGPAAPAAAGVGGAGSSSLAPAPVLSPVVVEALRSVLSPQGSYLQELLVDEMVAVVDALSREALSLLLRAALASGPAAAARTTLSMLGPLRAVLLPIPTPLELLARLEPAVSVTAEDREALAVLRGLITLAQRLPAPQRLAASRARGTRGALGTLPSAAGVSAAAGIGSMAARAARELGPLTQELLPGMAYTGELFMRALLRRAATRLAEGLRTPTQASGAVILNNGSNGGGGSILAGALAGGGYVARAAAAGAMPMQPAQRQQQQQGPAGRAQLGGPAARTIDVTAGKMDSNTGKPTVGMRKL